MTATIESVRKSVVVDAARDVAFRVFTEGMRDWWPLDTHHIGSQPAVDVVVEPNEEGRWLECAADGTECEWGRVLVWEPPTRVVLAWELTTQWQHDPNCRSEVEVRFTEDGPNSTRVELEHRGLEVFGDDAPQMVEIFSSEGGWGGLLQRYAAAAGKAS